MMNERMENMPKKNGMISVNEFEKAVKDGMNEYRTDVWRGIEISIKRVLSLKEMLSFVQNVVDACFGGKSGEYIPEAKDFAIRCAVVTYYTNMTLPSGLEKLYDFVYLSDITSFVISHVDDVQFGVIIDAIDEKVGALRDRLISDRSDQISEIYGALSTVADQVASAIGDIDIEKLRGISNIVPDVQEGGEHTV